MNITVFNKPYWLRRSGQQKVVKGHISSPFEDSVICIHIFPLNADQLQALPEGERKVKRLAGSGMADLHVGDPVSNQKGDLVYYRGAWYECVSCEWYGDTLLKHFNYQFTLAATDASGTVDLKPPVGDPVIQPESPENDQNAQEGGDGS